ncbi:MAG: mechanosensitive ion channel family protein [Gammaproteobacteria bacterium]|nr:mechanosensitive ion channel family protein [Gammaproteobacteria bacterium]
MESLTESFPLVALIEVVLVIAVAFGLNLLATKYYADKASLRTRMQVLQAVILLISLILIILIAPIGDARRGQLLSLLGIVLSAAVALSSTTVLGNAMAGLMLRSIRAFKPGDYINVGEHAGRVTEMDLLHSEIQTEDSDLTTLSNIYLVSNPFKVIRSQEGTIVSVQVSLGYDIPHQRIEELLLVGIKEAGLEEPFVQVLELGDFSVLYRAAGLLRPVKGLISARSRLRAAVLDALHGGGVEIVSPNFMNTRAIAADTFFIPKVQRQTKEAPKTSPDDIVFDKAEEAESLESMRERHKAMLDEIAAATEKLKAATEESETKTLNDQIAAVTRRADKLSALIEQFQEKLKTPS